VFYKSEFWFWFDVCNPHPSVPNKMQIYDFLLLIFKCHRMSCVMFLPFKIFVMFLPSKSSQLFWVANPF
jgi:hypothetical protein